MGFAGIPREVFDQIYRNRSRICGKDTDFLSETLKPGNGYYWKGHCNFFIGEFWKALSLDHHNALSDTGFAVIYIRKDGESDRFAEQLFPSILTIPVDWQISGTNRTTLGKSANDLAEKLRNSCDLAKQILLELKKELTEKDSSTPWLLPLKNFHSGVLPNQLRNLQNTLLSTTDYRATLRAASSAFLQTHPLRKVNAKPQRCFVDDRGIEFAPPGRARHAFARGSTAGHPKICLLAGRRRLGAPYDRAFHYDCTHGNRRVSGQFHGCHEPASKRVGNPHLNIAPNDFVRG